ncbi:MAG: hypothetical protein D6773_19630 [Alphaproteobacteria bacterium]|nr:MAG: hypothetical protein D6773_19630 [Alphaproteobacteria bacterium]
MLTTSRTSQPKDYIVLLKSPGRNGNSDFLSKLAERVDAPSKISFLQATNYDVGQYPRIVDALIPDYYESARARKRFRRRHQSTCKKVLAIGMLAIIILILFGLELAATLLVGGPNGPEAGPLAWQRLLQTALNLPWWTHALLFLIVVTPLALTSFYDQIVQRLQRLRGAPSPAKLLSESDKQFFASHQGYEALVTELGGRCKVPTFVWIDRADALDELSSRILLEALFETTTLAPRLVLFHLPPEDTSIERALQAAIAHHQKPAEEVIRLTLEPVDLDDRIAIAEALGKSRTDAEATQLIADLVEEDSPFDHAVGELARSLFGEDSHDGKSVGAGTLLALFATASPDGPRRFTFKELTQLFVTESSTFARFWLAVLGLRPPSKNDLRSLLKDLEKVGDVAFLTMEAGEDARTWSVNAKVQRIVQRELERTSSWLGGVHGFWASYSGFREHELRPLAEVQGHDAERALAGKPTATDVDSEDEGPEDDAEQKLRRLTYHLMRHKLPAEDDVHDPAAAAQLATSLVRAATRVVAGLLTLALLDKAHAVVEVLLADLLARQRFWSEAAFIREVERLAKEVWRLAMIRGASETIASFQRLLAANGARAGAKGIEASVKIFDAYNRAIRLQEVDYDTLGDLTISGGDEATRTALENMRRYATNISVLRAHGPVLECLEGYPHELREVREEILAAIQDAVPGHGFTLFEYLVRLQHVRAHLALGDLEQVRASLLDLAGRFTEPEQTASEWLFLVEAFRQLVLAEVRIVLLNSVLKSGQVPLQGALETFFSLRHDQATAAAIVTMLKEIEEALADARILHELFGALLGSACLLNAHVRFALARERFFGPKVDESSTEIWEVAVDEAKRLDCTHLWMGTLVARGRMRSHPEISASCLKEACLEAMRLGLSRPLSYLGRDLSARATIVDDKRIREVAVESLGLAIRDTRPEPQQTDDYLNWCNLKWHRANQLRVLDRAEEATAEIKECLLVDPTQIDDDHRKMAIEVFLSSRLLAGWLHKKAGDWQEVRSLMTAALPVAEAETWHGLPQILQLELEAAEALDEDIDHDATIARLLSRLRVASYEQRLDPIGLVLLADALLQRALERQLSPSTQEAIFATARDLFDLADEQVGIQRATNFLRNALRFPELRDDDLVARYENLVALEHLSAVHLTWFRQNLERGDSGTLLDFVLLRFPHRFVQGSKDDWLETIEHQLEKAGPLSLDAGQIESLIERSGQIHRYGGQIVVDPSVLMLTRIDGALSENGEEEPRKMAQASIRKALMRATRQILKMVAQENLVQPRLAQAMLGYLKLVDRFATV